MCKTLLQFLPLVDRNGGLNVSGNKHLKLNDQAHMNVCIGGSQFFRPFHILRCLGTKVSRTKQRTTWKKLYD
jgi:hypothetical protein